MGISRVNLPVLQHEVDEAIIEPGPGDDVIDEFVPGALVTIIFRPRESVALIASFT